MPSLESPAALAKNTRRTLSVWPATAARSVYRSRSGCSVGTYVLVFGQRSRRPPNGCATAVAVVHPLRGALLSVDQLPHERREDELHGEIHFATGANNRIRP